MPVRIALVALFGLALCAWLFHRTPAEYGGHDMASPAPLVASPSKADVELSSVETPSPRKEVSSTSTPPGPSPTALGAEPDRADEAAVEEEPPFDVPEGTVLMGRILGPNGESIDEAEIVLQVQGQSLDAAVLPDAFGRWALNMFPGEVGVFARHPEIGRSEEHVATLVEGEATDIGILTLRVRAQLRGRIQLSDGTPLPGVRIKALGVDHSPDGGSAQAVVRSDDEGSFTFKGLAQGSFALSADGGGDLPPIGISTFHTGDREAVLSVHAVLLRISLPKEAGEIVRMHSWSLRSTPHDEDHAGDFVSMSKSRSSGVAHWDHVVPGRVRIQVEGTDSAGRRYSRAMEAPHPSGLVEFILDPVNTRTGEALLTIAQGDPLKASEIRLGIISCNDAHISGTKRAVTPSSDLIQRITLSALPPGSYRFMLRAHPRTWAILREPTCEFELAEGATEEILIESVPCGKVHLTTALAQSGGPQEVRAQLFRAGASKVTPCSWKSDMEGRSTRGTRVLTNGVRGESELLPVGTYRLRLEADGLEPFEQEVVVLHRESTKVHVTLSPAP